MRHWSRDLGIYVLCAALCAASQPAFAQPRSGSMLKLEPITRARTAPSLWAESPKRLQLRALDAAVGEGAPTRSRQSLRLEPRERHFPFWLELGGAGLGFAGVVTGSIVLAFHGKRDPSGMTNYDNRPHGIAILVGGAQILVFSTVFLLIDQWPRSKRKTYASRARRLRTQRAWRF